MSLDFKVTHRSASFLDPFQEFKQRTYTVEVRRDPLFGDTSRILIFRRRPLGPIDHSVYLAQDPADKCPFCPERVDKYAARFTPDQVDEGHLRMGEAVCFPNAFPYEALNAVVVLSKQHYMLPAEINPELLADGLWLAREAFRRLGKGLGYGSVNQNYMMPAGAGLVHPHFQIVGSKAPTRAQAAMRSRARAYARKHDGASLAGAYVAAEKKAKARYIGATGPWHWMAAFAPRSLYDFIGLAPNNQGLLSITRSGVEHLAEGISRVLRFFEAAGIASYNLALHTGFGPDSGLPLAVRLVSRVDIPPKGVDEINYFHKLHDETLSFVPPEEAVKEISEVW